MPKEKRARTADARQVNPKAKAVKKYAPNKKPDKSGRSVSRSKSPVKEPAGKPSRGRQMKPKD